MRVPSSVQSSAPASMLTRLVADLDEAGGAGRRRQRDRALGDVVDHRRPLRRPGAVLHRHAVGEGGAIDRAEAGLQLGLEGGRAHDALDRRLVLRRRRRSRGTRRRPSKRAALQAGDAGLAVGVERARADPPRRRAGARGRQIELHVVLRRQALHRLAVRRDLDVDRLAGQLLRRRVRRRRRPATTASPTSVACCSVWPSSAMPRFMSRDRIASRPLAPWPTPATCDEPRSSICSTTSAAASSVTTAPSA